MTSSFRVSLAEVRLHIYISLMAPFNSLETLVPVWFLIWIRGTTHPPTLSYRTTRGSNFSPTHAKERMNAIPYQVYHPTKFNLSGILPTFLLEKNLKLFLRYHSILLSWGIAVKLVPLNVSYKSLSTAFAFFLVKNTILTFMRVCLNLQLRKEVGLTEVRYDDRYNNILFLIPWHIFLVDKTAL